MHTSTVKCRRLRVLCGAASLCGVLVLLAGCAAPTEAELASHAASQQEIAVLIDQFAQAVRDKDPEAASAMLGVDLNPSQRAVATVSIREATWLRLYTGYTPDSEAAAKRLSMGAARKGVAQLKVGATNADGTSFTDRFMFVRRLGKWVLANARLQQPLVGEELDLPPDVREKIRPVVKNVMQSFRQRAFTRIVTLLPAERDAYYRKPRPSFWQRLFGSYAEYSLYDDLERVRGFEVLHWPDADKELPLGFLGPTYVVAVYDVPYTWPEGGIDRPDNLRVELFVLCKHGEWRLHRLKLYAKGLAGTD